MAIHNIWLLHNMISKIHRPTGGHYEILNQVDFQMKSIILEELQHSIFSKKETWQIYNVGSLNEDNICVQLSYMHTF